jgi:hypothetical protein
LLGKTLRGFAWLAPVAVLPTSIDLMLTARLAAGDTSRPALAFAEAWGKHWWDAGAGVQDWLATGAAMQTASLLPDALGAETTHWVAEALLRVAAVLAWPESNRPAIASTAGIAALFGAVDAHRALPDVMVQVGSSPLAPLGCVASLTDRTPRACCASGT